MSSLRRRALRIAGVGLLLALLGVPLALSGHHHDSFGAASQESCAVCGALSGASTALLGTPPQLTIVVHAFAHHAAPVTAPTQRALVAQAARGPPASSTSGIA